MSGKISVEEMETIQRLESMRLELNSMTADKEIYEKSLEQLQRKIVLEMVLERDNHKHCNFLAMLHNIIKLALFEKVVDEDNE